MTRHMIGAMFVAALALSACQKSAPKSAFERDYETMVSSRAARIARRRRRTGRPSTRCTCSSPIRSRSHCLRPARARFTARRISSASTRSAARKARSIVSIARRTAREVRSCPCGHVGPGPGSSRTFTERFPEPTSRQRVLRTVLAVATTISTRTSPSRVVIGANRAAGGSVTPMSSARSRASEKLSCARTLWIIQS